VLPGARGLMADRIGWIDVRKIRKYRTLYLFLLPAVILVLVFSYRPMVGALMAFQDFDILKGLWGSPFVGLENFRDFLDDPYFSNALRNILAINGLAIAIGFPLPIILALMIFSMKDGLFKRTTQTISYLPHFISWVVVAGLLYKVLDERAGIVNQLLTNLGAEPVAFLREPKYFWWIAVFTGVWKELGWLTILYLAALSAIEAEQYEAAMIDGANGRQKLIYITLPGILPTIILVLVFTLGTLINTKGFFVIVPFDAIFNLRNPLISETANTLDFYIYQTGVLRFRYSYSAAIGLAQSMVAFVMVLSANWLSKKLKGFGAF
jgi:putative aldouronate transport system permease protein